MKIVLTGGGSGGHITPILAVASEIKRLKPDSTLIYVGQKGDRFGDIVEKNKNIDRTYRVRAGKFRRYNGEGLRQLLDISTFIKNVRDFFFVILGLVQSWRLMGKLKPDVTFSRGGYVSVVVCLGAKLHGVPYMTHDVDPLPSLTNKLLSPWAKYHLVALPKDIYNYPEESTVSTGIPISKAFVPITASLEREYKQKLNIDANAKVLLVIGGGQGARELNEAVIEVSPHLLSEFPELRIIHVAGSTNEDSVRQKYSQVLEAAQLERVTVHGFTDQVYLFSGAADLIITRAGATNLAEFALQGKACIVVPGSFLVGGHQVKSAEILANKSAVVYIHDEEVEKDANKLAKETSRLLHDTKLRQKLAENIQQFAYPNAAEHIAEIVIQVAEGK